MKNSMSYSIALAVMAGLLLSSCDWVDSAGDDQAPTTEVFLDGIPIGGAIVADEGSLTRITTARQSSSVQQVFTWSEEPLEQGALDVCADQDGFNASFAADTLQQACAAGVDCQLEFETVTTNNDNDVAEFNVQIPTLDAPVGLRYELTTEDDTGRTSVEEYSLCLIAINEAPVAVDDTFSVIEGSVLEVTADSLNLLSNDSDDTDVRNTALEVLPEPLVAPEFAAQFSLGTDGSFTYESSLTDLREDQFDSFTYQLSDGVFTPPDASVAVVTIRIVAANQAPEQILPIELLEATEGEPFSVELADNFVDPENGVVTFALSPQTPLATGSGLELSTTGELEGTPTAADVGSYQLVLLVSDGSLTSEVDIALEVSPMPLVPTNSAPLFVANTVFNQTVEVGERITPVEPEFTDADMDVLRYSTASTSTPRLPPGVTINTATGVISGRANVAGVYRGLRVRATDPSQRSAVSTSFTITVLGTN